MVEASDSAKCGQRQTVDVRAEEKGLGLETRCNFRLTLSVNCQIGVTRANQPTGASDSSIITELSMPLRGTRYSNVANCRVLELAVS